MPHLNMPDTRSTTELHVWFLEKYIADPELWDEAMDALNRIAAANYRIALSLTR